MAGHTVTRAQLTEAVYQEVGLSRNESAELVESVIAEIARALERGEMVKISSFGSFAVRQKGQRVGRNPKTGQEVPISPRRVLVFRASPVGGGEGGLGLKVGDTGQPPPARPEKSASAYRTIGEVAEDLDLPAHVLRFWESKFSQLKPLKRGGGRRYYRPEDIVLLRRIRQCLYQDGYTIRGVQKLLGDAGPDAAPRNG